MVDYSFFHVRQRDIIGHGWTAEGVGKVVKSCSAIRVLNICAEEIEFISVSGKPYDSSDLGGHCGVSRIGWGPCQLHPGTRVTCCGCFLPDLTEFTS